MSRKHPETTEPTEDWTRTRTHPAPTETAAAPALLAIAEGMDEAIYRQGWMEALRDANVGTQSGNPYVNPFDPATPQSAAWQAGYDAGAASGAWVMIAGI